MIDLDNFFKALDFLDSQDLDNIKLGRLTLESLLKIPYQLVDWYLIFARDFFGKEYLPLTDKSPFLPREYFKTKDIYCYGFIADKDRFWIENALLEDLKMPF